MDIISKIKRKITETNQIYIKTKINKQNKKKKYEGMGGQTPNRPSYYF